MCDTVVIDFNDKISLLPNCMQWSVFDKKTEEAAYKYIVEDFKTVISRKKLRSTL